jgi:hypothetical protein
MANNGVITQRPGKISVSPFSFTRRITSFIKSCVAHTGAVDLRTPLVFHLKRSPQDPPTSHDHFERTLTNETTKETLN